MRRRLALVATAASVVAPAVPAQAGHDGDGGHRIDHIVVIYQENRSFDNVYGKWGDVGGEPVRGLPDARPENTVQTDQNGSPFDCLYQNDNNLASPQPLPVSCTDTAHPAKQGTPATPQPVRSAFTNQPFPLDKYVPADAKTCDNGVPDGTGNPGGCTEDMTHRFYQHQYQLHDGKLDRFVDASSAAGLPMGHYDSTQLPIYRYLHGPDAPPYVLADNFFQAAFGGSFLNHQWLVAAQTPIFANADHSGVSPSSPNNGCDTGTANCDLHSTVDTNGMTENPKHPAPYYNSPGGTLVDGKLTVAADERGRCAPSFAGAVPPPPGTVCGDDAVNSFDPYTQPYEPGEPVGTRLPLLHHDNIGDQLSARHVPWAWYSEGWDNAAGNNGRDAAHPLGPGWTAGPTFTSTGTCSLPDLEPGAVFPNCPSKYFSYHHQPLAFFAPYADGTRGRVEHLKDEQNFLRDAARPGGLPGVSFVKAMNNHNEHPGESEFVGSQHLVDLLKAVEDGPNARNTMVVVTYDENGGQWDHVPPPGTPGHPGPHDQFGPGSRIPALVIAPGVGPGVDHTQYDTTSILATIEHRFHLPPLRLPDGRPARDARVADLFAALHRNGTAGED